MIHLGDITKISGYDAPIVDTVIFGAPCQDLSVAGKRQGMKHSDLGDEEGTRSGLFMEAVRIIKEMRDKDAKTRGSTAQFIRPRFAVYENVPGAFSSNKGEDFKIVLEELAKVADKDAVIPMPPKGKWANSGCIMGDGWSIAWRVLDGQFWGCTYVDDAGMPIRLGTPQRRKRIALVADFGGGCAPEILFERKGLRGDTSQSGNEGQGVTSDTKGGSLADDRTGKVYGFPLGFRPENVRLYDDKATTLCVGTRAGFCNGGVSIENHPADSRVSIDDSGKVQTLTSRMGTGGGNVSMVMEAVGVDVYNQTTTGDVDCALTAEGYTSTGSSPKVMIAVGIDCYNQAVTGDKSACLRAIKCDTDHIPCVAIDRAFFNQGKNALYDPQVYEDGTVPTLVAKGPSAVCYAVDQGGGKSSASVSENLAPTLTCTHGGEPAVAYSINHQGGNVEQIIEEQAGTLTASMNSSRNNKLSVAYYSKPQYIVRRLTPMECKRLQGYPDLWTDIGDFLDSKGKKKTSSDAVRYKALGNSICLPPWKWVLKRLCSHYERDVTMASLFDGIGGFPCLWEQINGKGTAVWSSEIEEFPDAVTKVRIG